jgi:ADP-sugar diphosphatase
MDASAATAADAASFSVRIHGADVPVECSPAAPGLDLARCIKAKPFVDWAAGLDAELAIQKVVVQSVDYFGPRVGFLKIEAVALFNGVRVPGICFLRGGAVSILVLLKCEGETWVVCTRQPRVPVGSAGLLELPAGMLDDSGAFAGVAAKELAEETGIRLGAEDLKDLTKLALDLDLEKSGGGGSAIAVEKPNKKCGMYPSAGGCDEFLRLMFHERNVTRAELDAMRGKATGNLEEGEVIVLELIRYDLLWRVCSDAKALSSMLLYERLRTAGAL